MSNFSRKIPDGDTHARDVCNTCGYIAYENPKIVAGAVVAHQGRVLLCKRAINPRAGLWTLPAGFLEAHEQPEEGALREAFEEAKAKIKLQGLIGIYTVKHLSQIHMMFRAVFDGPPDFTAGDETTDAAMFAWNDIPWDEIAFPSVAWALRTWHAGGEAISDLEKFSVKVK